MTTHSRLTSILHRSCSTYSSASSCAWFTICTARTSAKVIRSRATAQAPSRFRASRPCRSQRPICWLTGRRCKHHALNRATCARSMLHPPPSSPERRWCRTATRWLPALVPGSYAERRDVPDVTVHGTPKIVPLRAAPAFYVDPEDPNPVGMTVVGADGEPGGVVRDVWVDQAEYLIRYYEVETGAKGKKRNVLLPATLARVVGGAKQVRVKSILGHQFASVPAQKKPDMVTRLEEEKIFGYYGAGTLYATPQRAEPLL